MYTGIHTGTFIHVHVHVGVYTCMYMYMYVRTCTYIYKYMYMVYTVFSTCMDVHKDWNHVDLHVLL